MTSALEHPEEWRPVQWAEGYEISSHGRVGSWKPVRNFAKPPTDRRIIKLGVDRDGYSKCRIYVGTKVVDVRPMRLLCEAWHGYKSSEYVVRHKDGSKTNNTPSNLEWGTPQQNSNDRHRHGTVISGERVNTAKLTEDDVRRIHRSTEGHSTLARQYGVSPGAIWHIRAGRTWKHVST